MDNTVRINNALKVLNQKFNKIRIDEDDRKLSLGGPVGDMWITLSESTYWTEPEYAPLYFFWFNVGKKIVVPAEKKLRARLFVALDSAYLDEYIDHERFIELFERVRTDKQNKFDAKLSKLSKEKDYEQKE